MSIFANRLRNSYTVVWITARLPTVLCLLGTLFAAGIGAVSGPVPGLLGVLTAYAFWGSGRVGGYRHGLDVGYVLATMQPIPTQHRNAR